MLSVTRTTLLSIFLVVCSLSAGLVSAETWLVASEANYPPFNFNRKGMRTGIDIEIMDAVLAEMGVSAMHRSLSWPEVMSAVENNEVDVALQFVAAPGREKRMNLVGPFRMGWTVLMVREDDTFEYRSIESLAGRRVGVVDGFRYFPEFDTAQGIVKIPSGNILQLLRRLVHRRVDIVIGDRYVLEYLAKSDGLDEQVRVLENNLAEIPRYFALPLAKGANTARFQAALDRTMERGIIPGIVARYRPGTPEVEMPVVRVVAP